MIAIAPQGSASFCMSQRLPDHVVTCSSRSQKALVVVVDGSSRVRSARRGVGENMRKLSAIGRWHKGINVGGYGNYAAEAVGDDEEMRNINIDAEYIFFVLQP